MTAKLATVADRILACREDGCGVSGAGIIPRDSSGRLAACYCILITPVQIEYGPF